MKFARFVLIVTGLSFVGYGLLCLLQPAGMPAQFTGFDLSTPVPMVEAIAMYGGLQTGLGVFFIWAAVQRDFVVPALWCIVLMMGALAATRGWAMSVHGMVGMHPRVIVFEAATTLLALVAVLRLRRASAFDAFA